MADTLPETTSPEQIAAPQEPANGVHVFNPSGELVSIPTTHLEDALSQGYSPATSEETESYINEQKFGSPTQQLITGAEGAAKGVLGPIAPTVERALGVPSEDILGREKANPISSGIGEVAGLGGSLLSGVGAGAAAENLGAKAVSHLLPEATSLSAKIGSAATKGFIENALISGSDEVSKMILQDPEQSIGTAAAYVGLSGLIGGGLSGGIGAVSPLWEATAGPKVSSFLESIKNHVGGMDNVVPTELDATLGKLGIEVPPEIKASLSDDPFIQQHASVLNQSDTTTSGIKFQSSMKDFRKNLSDRMVEVLDKSPSELEHMPEINRYERGKELGDTLAKEYSAKLDPISKEFEALKEKYAESPIEKDISQTEKYTNQNANQTVGTPTRIADDLAKLVEQESWTGSPMIMREIRNIQRQLPKLKSIKDISQLATTVGNNTASTLPFGQQTPLSRAGALIKKVLQGAEEGEALRNLGKEAPELVERYKAARGAYREQALLKEALDDRLGVRGSTSGFAKGLREMSKSDGEAVLRKLSGVKDADLLNLLQKQFPETANLVRKYHIDDILQKAANKAKNGETINATQFLKGIDFNGDPNLRNFVLPGEAQSKIASIGQVLEKLNSLPNHNFSNTARTIDKLTQHMPGSAIGIAGMLTGNHGLADAVLIGPMVKLIGKDIPDAVRLSLLKYLGSGKEINATGFKAMVDYIQATIKGENLVKKATSNVFKAGREVLPEHLINISDKDRENLDKKIQKIQTSPESLLHSNSTTHYLPDHGAAHGNTVMDAANYINSQRPTAVRASPLDAKPAINPVQKDAFNRVLDIAQQPLLSVQHIKDGTLTPDEVVAVHTMYPALYTKLVNQLTSNMIDTISKGDEIPYITRIGLSMFIGQPLDSTMQPSSIVATQPVPRQAPPQAPKSSAGLTKLAKSYQTPNQTREARNQAS